MTILQSLFLGILQGLTEFLPISSSGHLVIAENFLGVDIDPKALLSVNVVLHAGTLLALLIMYFSRWVEMVFSLVTNNRPKRRVVFLLIIATIPAGIAGVLVDDLVSGIFSSLRSVGISLLITALVLWLGEWIGKKRKDQNVKYLGALWIGVFQACALVPGISRSGLTISAGRSVGLSRSDALDFSFLMLVPILMGAILLTGLDIINENIAIPDINILVVGFISSCAVSIAALLFLKKFVRSHSLSWFSVYLIVIGLVLIFLEL